MKLVKVKWLRGWVSGFLLLLLACQHGSWAQEESVTGARLKIGNEIVGIRMAFPWNFNIHGPEKIVANLVDGHINTILATVDVSQMDDPRLKELIDLAHAKGIGFQVVLSTFNAYGYGLEPKKLDPAYHGVNSNGALEEKWIDPCKPAVRKLVFDAVENAMALDVDGIQMDYFRFGDPQMGHSDEAKAAWKAWKAEHPDKNWEDWRDSVITGYARDLRALVKSRRPEMVFSCSTWTVGAGWPRKTILTEWGEGYGWEQGQNFGQLVEHVDYIRPMLYSCMYFKAPSWATKLTGHAVKNAAGRADVVVGSAFAVHDKSSKKAVWLTGEELRETIQGMREAAAKGIVFYHYMHLFDPKSAPDYAEFGYLDVLQEMFPPVSENAGYICGK